MMIASGCRVKMHYTLSLDSGEVLESTLKQEPLDFVFGSGEIIPGLEREIQGMASGQEKSIVVAPEDAYGIRDPQAVINVPKEDFPVEGEIEPGMVFRLCREDGMMIFATVVESSEADLTLDLNHPLAGETLHFEVKIVEVAAPEQQS